MPRRRVLVLAGAILLFTVLASGKGAGADPITKYGWWGAGEMTVASTAGKPTAYMAVAFDVPPGVEAVGLTLKAPKGAPSSGSGQLAICALTGTGEFTAATGGPLAQAPPYKCDPSIKGVPDKANGLIGFDITSLVKDGKLRVAVVATSNAKFLIGKPAGKAISTRPAPTTTLPATTAPPPTTAVPATEAPSVTTTTAPAASGAPDPAGSGTDVASVGIAPAPDGAGVGPATVGAGVVAGGAGGIFLRLRSRKALAPE
jgi:hypothetical protein